MVPTSISFGLCLSSMDMIMFVSQSWVVTSDSGILSSPRAKRAGWPKASALASLARLLLDFIHPPPPLAQLGTTLKVVRASFWAVRRSKCILRG